MSRRGRHRGGGLHVFCVGGRHRTHVTDKVAALRPQVDADARLMLLRLLLSMAAVVSSAADECFAPAGQLAGRLVVITGASRGVGAELARTFASEGAMVVVNYYKSKDSGVRRRHGPEYVGGRRADDALKK